MSWRDDLKDAVGPRWTTVLRCVARGKPLPLWGNLRRTRPFSDHFGFDRGRPIDRYYLRNFLEQHRNLITGDALEIQGTGTTRQFGVGLRSIDSVDIDPTYKPTYLCDLADAEGVIPSNRYDCFMLPNTLNVLKRIEECLKQALRVVKPGGVILASAASFVPLIADGPDYWRLSAAGWREIAARAWPGCEVRIEGHGNVLAATAALLGLAVEELTSEELDIHDPRYPVLVTLFCRKPEASP